LNCSPWLARHFAGFKWQRLRRAKRQLHQSGADLQRRRAAPPTSYQEGRARSRAMPDV
jgi:hypothetical protein